MPRNGCLAIYYVGPINTWLPSSLSKKTSRSPYLFSWRFTDNAYSTPNILLYPTSLVNPSLGSRVQSQSFPCIILIEIMQIQHPIQLVCLITTFLLWIHDTRSDQHPQTFKCDSKYTGSTSTTICKSTVTPYECSVYFFRGWSESDLNLLWLDAHDLVCRQVKADVEYYCETKSCKTNSKSSSTSNSRTHDSQSFVPLWRRCDPTNSLLILMIWLLDPTDPLTAVAHSCGTSGGPAFCIYYHYVGGSLCEHCSNPYAVYV